MSEGQPFGIVGILRLFADIVRFRKGPEDLPVSRALLVSSVIACVIAQTLLAGRLLPPEFEGSPLAMMLVDAAVTLVFVAMVVALARHPERFLQTASAVFGCQLLLLPAAAMAGVLQLQAEMHPDWKLPAQVVALALQVWLLAVLARILRSATGWPLVGCLAATLLADLVTLAIITSIFTVADPAQLAPGQVG